MTGFDLLGAEAPVEAEAEVVEEKVKKVNAKVSPWLWILSIVGFLAGMQNRFQIQKMYGNWKAMKRTLGSK